MMETIQVPVPAAFHHLSAFFSQVMLVPFLCLENFRELIIAALVAAPKSLVHGSGASRNDAMASPTVVSAAGSDP